MNASQYKMSSPRAEMSTRDRARDAKRTFNRASRRAARHDLDWYFSS
jgi:hypothetical protein